MLFIISVIILCLSTALTLFSIFFNYDEDKPVKLSKYGWIAVVLALLLAFSNGVVKTIENSENKKQQIYNDSLQNSLILKNELLLKTITRFETSSNTNMDEINSEIKSNLVEIKNTNNKLNKIASKIENSQSKLIRQIHEDSHTMPDSMEFRLVFGFKNNEELFQKIIDTLKQKGYNLSEIEELRSKRKNGQPLHKVHDKGTYIRGIEVPLETILFDFCLFDFTYNTETEFYGGFEAAPRKFKSEFEISDNSEYLNISLDFMAEVFHTSKISNIYDLCRLVPDIRINFVGDLIVKEPYWKDYDVYYIEMIYKNKHMILENTLDKETNNLIEVNRDKHGIHIRPKFNNCWYETLDE